MVIVWALSWWYGAGWRAQFARVWAKLESTYDYFSIGLLASSLFAPFRQISAGRVDGPLAVQMRAFFDRQLSRVIGAFVRTILIVVGIVLLTLQSFWGVVTMIFWGLLPFLPLIGFTLMLSGWVPTWR